MNSFNPAAVPAIHHIEALHAAYCAAVGVELPLNACFTRWWWDAHKMGAIPDDVDICIKERLRIKRTGGMNKGIEIRHLAKDDERIAEMLNEAAVVRAQMRIKVVPAGKRDVLQATGRPVEEETKTRHISEVIEAMRKQAS